MIFPYAIFVSHCLFVQMINTMQLLFFFCLKHLSFILPTLLFALFCVCIRRLFLLSFIFGLSFFVFAAACRRMHVPAKISTRSSRTPKSRSRRRTPQCWTTSAGTNFPDSRSSTRSTCRRYSSRGRQSPRKSKNALSWC